MSATSPAGPGLPPMQTFDQLRKIYGHQIDDLFTSDQVIIFTCPPTTTPDQGGLEPMGKPEAYVENYLVDQADKRGLYCLKFTSPGYSGVPDRIVISPAATVFVELKALGEKPRRLQEIVIDQMRQHGAEVHVIDTREGVDALLDDLLSRTP